MGLGGYDMGYEIYYKGTPIGRVDYGDREYELYVDEFITRDTLPEFLAAIDARGFKNIHEKEDEDFDDDDGPRYVKEESFGSLETFLAKKEKEFKPSGVNPSWNDSEDKFWAVQEYLSSMGEFTDEDKEFLKKTDPEILAFFDEDEG